MRLKLFLALILISFVFTNESFIKDTIKFLSNSNIKSLENRNSKEKDILLQKANSDKSYDDIVKQIKNEVSNNPKFKFSSYNRVAYLVDTFGPRLWGSEPLKDATEFMRDELLKEGFENVRLEENKNSLHWVRGKESLTLFSPRKYPSNIPMVGLGRSVGGRIKSELIVLKSFDELKERQSEVKDKIVLFNAKWTNYDKTVQYRENGPSQAAKYGAKGCIVRSITSVSIESPHTGTLDYDNSLPKIPACAISLESADMFQRMSDRGQKIVLELNMEAHLEESVSTYNVIGEIQGSQYPNEIILMGGHIDSWDVGPQTGANDDAAGFMVCMEAVRVLLKLNLRPKRTIRFIAWSGEEFGHRNSGAPSYMRRHKAELKDHIIGFESDLGTTNLIGWGFSGGKNGFKLFKNLHNNYLSKNLNMDKLVYGDGVMVDTEPLYNNGIPVVRNLIEDTPDQKNYFSVHHSAGDSVSVLSKEDMDKNVMGIASMFYIIADLPDRFPRD